MFFIQNHEFHFIEYDNTCIYTCTYTLRSCELFKLMYFLVLPSAFTNSLLILYFLTGKQFHKKSEAGLGGNNLHNVNKYLISWSFSFFYLSFTLKIFGPVKCSEIFLLRLRQIAITDPVYVFIKNYLSHLLE